MMVEVFKTNVNNHNHAKVLLEKIHNSFRDYEANFDLEDCDKILRVKSTFGPVDSILLLNFLKSFGCVAEVLPDTIHKLEITTDNILRYT
jgi:hypothetical protein